jgi:hypothetical protein
MIRSHTCDTSFRDPDVGLLLNGLAGLRSRAPRKVWRARCVAAVGLEVTAGCGTLTGGPSPAAIGGFSEDRVTVGAYGDVMAVATSPRMVFVASEDGLVVPLHSFGCQGYRIQVDQFHAWAALVGQVTHTPTTVTVVGKTSTLADPAAAGLAVTA